MSNTKLVLAGDLHAKHYAESESYRNAYDDLEEEYALISASIETRTCARLSPTKKLAREGQQRDFKDRV